MKAARSFRLAVVVSVFATLNLLSASANAQPAAAQAQPAAAQAQPAAAQAQPSQATAQPVPMTESSNQLDRMAIRVVSSTTGEPVAGVDLQFTGRIGIRNANRTLKTNAEGKTELIYPSGANIPNLRFTSRKTGFVPVNYNWQVGQNQGQIVLPKELEVKLEPGTKMGGIVVDEQQQPIAGVQVRLSMPVTWPRTQGYYFTFATLATDKNGHWQFDDGPSDVTNLSTSVTHPDYKSSGIRMALGTENIFVLKQGLSLRGTVVDQEGKPVGFARVMFGDNRYRSDRAQTVTDAEGLFVLKNCEPGASFVTVQSDTHAPQMQRVVVGTENEPLKITVEPGHVLRGRIVDTDGKPISGVSVATEYWQEMQLLDNRFTSDAEGRFEWPMAPADGVKYSIFRQGYMSVRNLALPANGEEQLVKMNLPLVISGRVTDATTGEPIKSFQLQRGQNQEGGRPYWYQGENSTFSGGTYTYTYDEPNTGWLLRALADGYLPTDSRVFKPEEGKVTFDFALKPGKGSSGLVLLPNGEPAVGAEIALWRQNTYIRIEGGRLGRQNSDTTVITSDKDGKFTLQPQSESDPFLLVVLHEAGFADVTSQELAKSERITLKGWGQLEGQVFLGDKPEAGRLINYNPQRQPDQNDALRNNFYGYGYQATTDAEGRFRFDRVVPGKGTVSRITVTQWANYSTHNPGWTSSIDVRPGETTKVKIGGTGRPVVGKIVTDREPDAPISWTQNEPANITPRAPRRSLIGALLGQSSQAADSNARYVGPIDAAGKFNIPDVPAGEYTLMVSINEPPSPNGNRYNIGNATFDFAVPKMEGERSDETLDLGVITAKLSPVLEPGAVAPAVSFPSIDGKTVRMSDYRGKLVLVSFLAAERGSDMSSLATLKRVYEKFGKDANFVMVTVWCGYDTASIKQAVEGNGLKWQHGTTQHVQMPEPQAFMVRTLPTTYLIGANGKVISRNAKEDELKKSIESILSLGELYFLEKGQ